MPTKASKKINTIRQARQDIARVLDRYRVTMPEVMGVSPEERDIDEIIWESVRKDYEKIQQEVFAKTYPDLWKKLKKK